jgi:hypothetical protein
VENGHQPFGGHVGAEVAATAPSIDQRAQAPVGGPMDAFERLGGELFAGGLGDCVVAVKVAPTDVDDARDDRGLVMSVGMPVALMAPGAAVLLVLVIARSPCLARRPAFSGGDRSAGPADPPGRALCTAEPPQRPRPPRRGVAQLRLAPAPSNRGAAADPCACSVVG